MLDQEENEVRFDINNMIVKEKDSKEQFYQQYQTFVVKGQLSDTESKYFITGDFGIKDDVFQAVDKPGALLVEEDKRIMELANGLLEEHTIVNLSKLAKLKNSMA